MCDARLLEVDTAMKLVKEYVQIGGCMLWEGATVLCKSEIGRLDV